MKEYEIKLIFTNYGRVFLEPKLEEKLFSLSKLEAENLAFLLRRRKMIDAYCYLKQLAN